MFRLQQTHQQQDAEPQDRTHDRRQPLDHKNTGDTTRRIGKRLLVYDGSLAKPVTSAPVPGPDLEARAFLLTSEGGVMAELPCTAGSPAVIGRGQSVDIRVLDPYVHRQHATIHWDADLDAHILTDGGGENGTFVNRHRVRAPMQLIGGERLRLGKTVLTYRIRR